MKKKNNFVRGFVYLVRHIPTGRMYCGQQSKWYSQGLEPEEIMGKKYWTSNKGLAKDWREHPDDYEWQVVRDNIVDKRDLDFGEACCIMELWERKIPTFNRIINVRLAWRKSDEPENEQWEVDYV